MSFFTQMILSFILHICIGPDDQLRHEDLMRRVWTVGQWNLDGWTEECETKDTNKPESLHESSITSALKRAIFSLKGAEVETDCPHLEGEGCDQQTLTTNRLL